MERTDISTYKTSLLLQAELSKLPQLAYVCAEAKLAGKRCLGPIPVIFTATDTKRVFQA